MSLCGRFRKATTSSSSHLGGDEGEGVPGEHVWQVKEGLPTSSSHLGGDEGEGVPGEHVWQVEEGLHSLQLSP